jgi:microcystin-dependent protein
MPLETASHVSSLVPTNPANADPVQQGADHLRLIKQALVNSFPNVNAPVTATPTQINSWEARIAGVERAAPVGAAYFWLGGAAPTDHLLLNGATYNRADYPVLWTTCGPSGSNILGPGNGTTTFTVPDARLRFPVMPGTGLLLGATGGSQTPTVTVASNGAHTHTGATGADGAHSHGGATGSDGAHNHGGATGGHALTPGQMPLHNHGVNDSGHAHGMNASGNVLKLGADTLLGYATGTPFSTYIGWGILGGTDGAFTGISIQSAGNNEAHSHTIAGAAAHTHTITAAPTHTHTIASDGAHAHTATIADGRPPFIAFNFIIRAR